MAFNKADRLKAKELLAKTIDTKSYRAPKRKSKAKRKKPGPKPRVSIDAPLKKGPFSDAEKNAVETLVKTFATDQSDEDTRIQTHAMALALRRTPESIRANVVSARERLMAGVESAVEDVYKASRIAAREGDSRPAQWILEHAMTKDEKGKTIRVVEPTKGGDNGPRMPVVNIGVNLGGISPGASLTNLPTVTVETIEEDEP